MNKYYERIKCVQALMKKYQLDMYIVPSSDYHLSEYSADYFGFRKWLSGFTGSAGTLLITKDKAYLWTDGRYFLQATNQLKGSKIKLMKMGVAKVFTIDEFIEANLKKGMTLGFDGKVMALNDGIKYEAISKTNKAKISYQYDLSKELWTKRPELPKEKIYLLDVKWAGEKRESKLKRVKQKLKENEVKYQVLTSLDDIAWLLNIRGNDVSNNPVCLAYAIIGDKKVKLYLDKDKLSSKVINELKDYCEFYDYHRIYQDIKKLNGSILMDPNKVNYSLYKLCKGKIKLLENPEILMKAIKNEVEIKNLKQAHIFDGVAVTKFIYWLKKEVKSNEITEYDATEKLEALRKENKYLLDLSFPSIGAYNENAAMMHYSATKEKAATLKPKGLYLIDSGGHYYQGTTDITRTIVLGPISNECKRDYTLVLKGHLALAMAKFLYGCRGINLDILTRGPLWNLGIDYRSGTGHGVGYLLNVHEAPNGIRWKIVPERNDSCILEENMVTTDEPGIYLEGKYGIRIENELVSKKWIKNEYGQFMNFEIITLAPIDLDGIDPNLLTDEQITFLNNYHKMVYEKLNKYLTTKEQAWLKKETRAIKKIK